MKTVLIVSDEVNSLDHGLVTKTGEYGLNKVLYNIDNLYEKVKATVDANVIVAHHSETAKILESRADYIILSGRFSPCPDDTIGEEFADIIKLIKNANVPILGICQGIQNIAVAFGNKVDSMEDRSGEHGFTTIQNIKPSHPLLTGIGKTFKCIELHGSEVKGIPEGFELLAKTEKCQVQMIAHKTKPIFGTQFHPEIQTEENKDGQTILENFFKYY